MDRGIGVGCHVRDFRDSAAAKTRVHQTYHACKVDTFAVPRKSGTCRRFWGLSQSKWQLKQPEQRMYMYVCFTYKAPPRSRLGHAVISTHHDEKVRWVRLTCCMVRLRHLPFSVLCACLSRNSSQIMTRAQTLVDDETGVRHRMKPRIDIERKLPGSVLAVRLQTIKEVSHPTFS